MVAVGKRLNVIEGGVIHWLNGSVATVGYTADIVVGRGIPINADSEIVVECP